MTLVSDSALVLVAQVPKAGGRWTQVHFNRDVVERLSEYGAVGYMPQVWLEGAWRDALNESVDLLDTARRVTSVVKVTPTRIVQRRTVDQVVWL